MSGQSAIEWCESTWNVVTGCDRESPGRAHCYALDLAPRLRAMGVRKYRAARDGGRASGPAFGVTLHLGELEVPRRWRRPRRIFACSMGDLFHEQVPFAFIDRVFETIAACPQHVFQVLTKRAARMRAYCEQRYEQHASAHPALGVAAAVPWPNVWLGVSIENRRYVDRADELRLTPAAVRFISAEPLLGPLIEPREGWEDGYRGPGLDLDGIDWLIVGGESGPHHRPIRPAWVRDLRDATRRSASDQITRPPAPRCAFFFKQWGGRTPKAGGRLLDGRSWDELPAVKHPALETTQVSG